MKNHILFAAAALSFVLPAITVQSEASAGKAIHADCLDNAHPEQCTQVLAELESEMGAMVQAYSAGDLDAITSFQSPGVIYKIFDEYNRGAASYVSDLMGPLFAFQADGLDLDVSNLRFQVINEHTVIQYGVVSETLRFKNGFSLTTDSRVTVTWVRSSGPGSGERPFVIAANMHEQLDAQ